MSQGSRVVSRTSLLILSFVLVHAALSGRIHPALAVSYVLLGATGLIAYVGCKWVALCRNRRLVRKLLIVWACRSAAATCQPY
ncbi:MAG: hypothetical protein ACT4QC_06790 [Planctomycetaceae bacterium]